MKLITLAVHGNIPVRPFLMAFTSIDVEITGGVRRFADAYKELYREQFNKEPAVDEYSGLRLYDPEWLSKMFGAACFKVSETLFNSSFPRK
jgi:hypothetical protein